MVSKRTLAVITHYVVTAIVLKILGYILPNTIVGYYECTAKLLLFVLLSTFTFEVAKRRYFQDKVDPLNKAVLITGCDSGFGHHLAKRLDSRGYRVFACCLFPTEEGATELQKSCSERLHVLGLDVTNEDSINEALIYVKENLGSSDLWAIVNNAGILRGSNAELSSIKDYKDTMEVNAFGLVRVTKAFLPLLRQSRGRIVNLTSLAGKLAGPHLTPYTMSKHAAKAFSECLAQEIEIWGIKVISIEPEFFKTSLTNSETIGTQLTKEFENLPPEVKKEYGENYLDDLKNRVESVFASSSPKLNIVIDDLESAVSLKDPDSTYICYANIIHAIGLYAMERLPRSFQSFFVELHLILFYGRLRRPYTSRKCLR